MNELTSADRTASLLRQMFPDTSAPPSPLVRAKNALNDAIDKRNRMSKVDADQLPALRERIAQLRAEVKRLSYAVEFVGGRRPWRVRGTRRTFFSRASAEQLLRELSSGPSATKEPS